MNPHCKIVNYRPKNMDNVVSIGSVSKIDDPYYWPLINAAKENYDRILVIGEYKNGAWGYHSNFESTAQKHLMLNQAIVRLSR